MLLNLDNLQFLIHHKLHLHLNHLNKYHHSYSIVLQKYIGHYQQLCKKNHSYKLTQLNILHKMSIHMNHHHLSQKSRSYMQFHYLWKYLHQYIQQPLFHRKHHLHQSRLNKHYHNQHNQNQINQLEKSNFPRQLHFHYSYMLLYLDNL